MAIIPLKATAEKPSLGISACLMGEKVRFNGGHKRSTFCVNVLSDFFSFTSLCPEVAIGLGVPRKAIHLTGNADHYDATDTDDTSFIVTQPLVDYATTQAKALSSMQEHPISGYILMQKSPSCGMERVKIYDHDGVPKGDVGLGIYAKTLMEALPLLPFEEEGRLHDAIIRENFFTRVYAYHRWQQLAKSTHSYKDIEAFYARYKYVLMAHSPNEYSQLGQYLANHANTPLHTLDHEFATRFMTLLKKQATKKTHTNVLLHLLGYLKKTTCHEARQNLLTEIESYRTGIHPLIVPIRLLRHHLLQEGNHYIKRQFYLSPYPDELGLRNAV